MGRDAALALLERALVAPVLTAHPTEVRRKSMIDHRNRIAELMRLRDIGAQETPDGELVEEAIRRQIALLWQTRPLRRERLYVADEVEIRALLSSRRLPAGDPRAARALGTRLRRAHAELSEARELDRRRPRRQSERQRGLAAPRARPRVRSRDRRLSRTAPPRSAPNCRSRPSWQQAGPEVEALAAASGDRSKARTDEPYRRAISGMYARLAATYQKLTGRPPQRPAASPGEAYATPEEFGADLKVLARPLRRRWRWRARPADSRGRDVRISPRRPRPAAECRRARAGGGRAAQGGGRRGGLSRPSAKARGSRCCGASWPARGC